MSVVAPSLECVPGKYNAGLLFSQLPMDGSGDFTVTRTTTPTAGRATRVNAAGLIETVTDNVPRLDYLQPDGTIGCPALLVEPSATNLLTRSQQLDHGDWARGAGVNVIGNVSGIIAPDGSQTASLITATTQSLVIGINQNGKTVPTGSPNTKSVYLRGVVGGESVRLRDPNQTIGTTTCVLTTSWQRFTLTETQTGGVGGLWITNIPSGGIYAWGAQLEVGSVATSYIPTTTAAVTRSADVISRTGASAVIGQTEGTAYIEVDFTQGFTRGAYILTLRSSNTVWAALIIRSNGRLAFQVTQTSSPAVDLGNVAAGQLSNAVFKIAFAYKSGDYALYMNGVQVGTAASTGVPTSLNEIRFSSEGTLGNDPLQGKVRALALYPTRRSNIDLVNMTAPDGSFLWGVNEPIRLWGTATNEIWG